ncbi:hypothetical protein, partial [Klebsiella pneumoniae]|uniref:hypothetical protein n=1 Tax=Klebsiella pneumoniae TaxID=573 RepID=UPI0025B189A2
MLPPGFGGLSSFPLGFGGLSLSLFGLGGFGGSSFPLSFGVGKSPVGSLGLSCVQPDFSVSPGFGKSFGVSGKLSNGFPILNPPE